MVDDLASLDLLLASIVQYLQHLRLFGVLFYDYLIEG